jgi:hypothetical protein
VAADPLIKLPPVLAGPVVRYCDSRRLTIWLASSTPLRLRGEAYSGSAATKRRIGFGETAVELRLGERLYVQIIIIKPDPKVVTVFPPALPISYDLLVGPGDGRAKSTSIFEGIADRSSVCLPGRRLPEIRLARSGRLPTIDCYFGSCRKLGGIGSDAASALLHELEAGSSLPSHLFLLGDQVYGDDVPGLIAPALFQLAKEMAGNWEHTPLKNFDEKYRKADTRASLVTLGERQNVTGFTVDKAVGLNHLLTEYEYAAIHIAAWNGAVWDILKTRQQASSKNSEEEKRTLEQIASFRKGVESMQRLLANIPTYMLFDDHDVTDDWNLDIAWKRGLMEAGVDAVGAAMGVYATFQAWGNGPSAEADPAAPLVAKFLADRAKSARNGKKAPSIGVLGEDLQKLTWSFAVPSNPPTIFVDTRTKRISAAITEVHTYSPPPDLFPISFSPRLSVSLIGESLESEIRKMTDKEDGPIILATPTPVFSHVLVDALKGLGVGLVAPFIADENYKYDLEEWQANPESLLRLIGLLAGLKSSRFVILCGDVHYSFSLRCHITIRSRVIEILQLCSSAMLNESPDSIQRPVRIFDKAVKTTSLWWWNSGDAAAGFLVNPEARPIELELLERKFAGKLKYKIESEIFPISWYPASAGTPSVEFVNSIGRLYSAGDLLRGLHLRHFGSAIRRSRTVDLPARGAV